MGENLQKLPSYRAKSRYKIEKIIGSGGMGKVYLAKDLQLSQSVALKFLSSQLNSPNLSLFKKEVVFLSQFSHPNLVKIFDFYGTGHCQKDLPPEPFFSMEYVQGKSLQQFQKKGTTGQYINLLIQFCRGLHYLHSRQILHRDLKPSNIILQPSQEIKILDFGLSEIVCKQSSLDALGTLSYMPPEAFWGEYNEQSDLFSLGVLLYELISGKLPFQNSLSTLQFSNPPSLKQHEKNVPIFLSDLIDKLIALHPSQRPSSAISILKYLNQHIDTPIDIIEEESSQKILQKVPWVGRKEEIKCFWENMENFSTLQNPILMNLSGPTGVGRSRFLEEIKWQLQLKGFTYFSFSPRESLTWFSVILDRFIDNQSENSNEGFLAEIRQLLSFITSQQMVLTFTDLHLWPLSTFKKLQLFLQITKRAKQSMLIILEYNSDAVPQDLQFILNLSEEWSNVLTFNLKDLSLLETQKFIQQATLDNPINESLCQEIAVKSGGRPLLIVESLRSLSTDTIFEVPKNLQEICEVRVSSLSQIAQLLLACIVVHEEIVTLEEIENLWGPSLDELSKAFSELEIKNFIQTHSFNSTEINLLLPSLKDIYQQVLPPSLTKQSLSVCPLLFFYWNPQDVFLLLVEPVKVWPALQETCLRSHREREFHHLLVQINPCDHVLHE